MASPTPFPCTPYCVSVGSIVLFNLILSHLSRDQTSNDEVDFEENISQRDPLVLDEEVEHEEEQPFALPSDPAPLGDTHQDTTFKDATSIAFTLPCRFHPFH